MQPLPVGETGVSEGKGKGRGGGSPGLQQAPDLIRGLEGWGYPPLGQSLYPCPSEGRSPFSFACERGRYRMAKTGTGLVSPARRGE